MKAVVQADNHPAWLAHQRLQELSTSVKLHFLEMGRELRVIVDERGYEFLGHPTFASYMADPEYGYEFSPRTAYRMIGAFGAAEKYGYDLVTAAGISKTDMVRGHITDDKSAVRLLNMAATTSREDLKRNLEEEFAGVEIKEEWCQCEICGHRHLRRNDAAA